MNMNHWYDLTFRVFACDNYVGTKWLCCQCTFTGIMHTQNVALGCSYDAIHSELLKLLVVGGEGPWQRSRYSDSLPVGRSWILAPDGTIGFLFFWPLKIKPETRPRIPALFPMGWSGRGVELTPKRHSAPMLGSSRDRRYLLWGSYLAVTTNW